MADLDLDLDNIFDYHPPTEDQKALYEDMREAFKGLAGFVADRCPGGPGLTVAIRKLSEAQMAVNACIARDGKF